MGSIALDDHQLCGLFDALVGGEATLASETFAAAADDLSAVALAAVDHFIVVGVAVGAVHVCGKRTRMRGRMCVRMKSPITLISDSKAKP